jgi:hypothetical protein
MTLPRGRPRVQGEIAQAQGAIKDAKDAYNAKKWDDAIKDYQKAEGLDAGLKTQTDTGISDAEASKGGKTPEQVEQASYDRGTRLLKTGDYKGAESAFKSVVDRNLPGSKNIAKAQDQLTKLSTLVQDQGKFEDAKARFDSKNYDAAKPVFDDLVSRNTPFKQQSQGYLKQINDANNAKAEADKLAAATAANANKQQALQAAMQNFNSLKGEHKYDDARNSLSTIAQQGKDTEGLKSDLESAANAEFKDLQSKRTDAKGRKDTAALEGLKGSFEDLAKRDSGDQTMANRARDVAENLIPADLDALKPAATTTTTEVVKPKPDANVTTPVTQASVSPLAWTHTKLTGPFNADKVYDSSAMDEAPQLQNHPLGSDVAPNGTSAMIKLEVSQDGQVVRQAACMQGGADLCQKIESAAKAGWKFAPPKVSGNAAKVAIAVRVKF